jgi:hypothetical protein
MSKKNFSNANTNFFLVILIEILILKTTMLLQVYRLCPPFCAKHGRHLCAVPMLLFVICFSS